MPTLFPLVAGGTFGRLRTLIPLAVLSAGILVGLGLRSWRTGPVGGSERGALVDPEECRLELADVFGESRRVCEWYGNPVMLSFLVIPQAGANDEDADRSRSQVVVLRSVKEQYGSQGLMVVVVDASAAALGDPTNPEFLLNVFYDWDLAAMTLLVDHTKEAVSGFGVSRFPTTLLLDRRHQVARRWDGFVPAVHLVSATKQVLAR